jgi:hypothetical protein
LDFFWIIAKAVPLPVVMDHAAITPNNYDTLFGGAFKLIVCKKTVPD